MSTRVSVPIHNTSTVGSSTPLFELDHVSKNYPLARSPVGRLIDRSHFAALTDISLHVAPGDRLGIVGESGSGKTTLARLMVNLTTPTTGSVRYRGQDLCSAPRAQQREFHNQVQMVFQSTQTSLNPRKTIETTLLESLRPGDDKMPLSRLLDMARLPATVLPRYPHQLSGGQRQRVGIARAIARRPELIIADEPTSALDVSLQGEVIDLLRELHREAGLTLVVISHDLAMVAQLCASVIVMNKGRIVESGDTRQVLRSPSDPYTRRLIDAIPRGIRRDAR